MTKPKKSLLTRFLDMVEYVGNKLPDPVTLFFILIVIVLFGSWIATLAGLSAIHPGTKETISAISLFSKENVIRIFTQMPATFTGFAPLGMVLVVMLGIGVADKTGMISAALKTFVLKVPRSLLTASLVFAGIMSSMAVDAGYVVLIPLGAVIFMSAGRHPLAGLAATFSGVSGGFSANLIVTSLDPLLASFTEPAAQLLDPTYSVNAASNYYLMVLMVPLYTLVGWFATEKIVEPRLGTYSGDVVDDSISKPIEAIERKGLRRAGLIIALLMFLIALLVVPENGVLRDASASLSIAPFLSSIVALMMFLFLVPGIVYGVTVGKIKSDKQVAEMMADSMSSLGSYIVLAFTAAHFVAFFNWSNLGVITAIRGAEFLSTIGFTGIPLLIAFLVFTGFINLFIGSASAKWALMAPIFVPMLMLMGLSPEVTQATYRLGDSFTNIITPLMAYFPLVIIYAQKYQKDLGIGTLISIMLPYSLLFLLLSIVVLVIWILTGIPVGPDSPLYYTVPSTFGTP
jgi:aminobenzoyl-glutamate transport protein